MSNRLAIYLRVIPFITLSLFAKNDILLIDTNGIQSSINWIAGIPNDNHFLAATEESAILGNRGITARWDLRYAGKLYANCKTSFMKRAWFRFFVRLDSFYVPAKPQRINNMTFHSLNVSEAERAEYRRSLIKFDFILSSEKELQPTIQMTLQASADRTKNSIALVKIDSGTVYCIEVFLDFFSNESLTTAFYVDGKQLLHKSEQFSDPRNHFLFSWSNHGDFDIETRAALSMDEFTVSDKRIYTIPPKPKATSYAIRNDSLFLECTPFQSNYIEERQKCTEWKLFPDSLSIFPLFHAIDSDPFFFHRRPVSMPLCSGKYFWSVRFKNSFNCWGEWRIDSFNMTNEIIKSAPKYIDDVFISNLNGKNRYSEIKKDKWYKLNVQINNKFNPKKLWYLIGWMNDSSYTLGSLAAKGGVFLPSSNYIFNVTFNHDTAYFFEKKSPNSTLSSKLPTDSMGLYTIANYSVTALDDSIGSIISFPFRLLESANTGLWRIAFSTAEVTQDSNNSAYDAFSPLSFHRITVVDNTQNKRKISVIALSLIAISAIIIFTLFKRKEMSTTNIPAIPNMKEISLNNDYERIISILRENLDGKYNSEAIRIMLKLSKFRFYHILKQKKATIPMLLNGYRIEKAKKLLNETDTSISEVAYLSGFNELQTFLKTFKTLEGTTPGLYRKNKK